MLEKFIAFDTETTGFDYRARILSISIIAFENGLETYELTQTFLPDDVDWKNPDVKKALSINGLTPDVLQDSPSFERCAHDIHKLMGQFDVWVAHNAKFDVRMLSQEYHRVGLQIETPKYLVCTYELDKLLNPKVQHHKLGDVAEIWGVDLQNAHTADADARACGRILDAMKPKLASDFRTLEKVTSGVTLRQSYAAT